MDKDYFNSRRQFDEKPRLKTETERVVVGISGLSVARGNVELITFSLGSCVGICMYDKVAKIGSMAHCLLPSAKNAGMNVQQVIRSSELGKFVDVAVDKMIQLMLEMGAARQRLTAEVYGGANMFSLGHSDLPNIGRMNTDAVQSKLGANSIPIIHAELGGTNARTILFNVGTGEVKVRVTQKTLKSISQDR